MALASAGEIRYQISTSSSVAPYNQHMPADALDEACPPHQDRRHGRASGCANSRTGGRDPGGTS
jgi:hypothetical protein